MPLFVILRGCDVFALKKWAAAEAQPIVVLFECQSRLALLTSWAFPLVNIRAISSINVTAVTAPELVDFLKVIGSGRSCVSNHHLPIPVDVSRLNLSLDLL